jgi:hypothetical protein
MPSPVSTYGQVVPGKPMIAGQVIITFPIGVRATSLGGRGGRRSPTSSALVTAQSRSLWQPVSVCWRSYASLRLTLWSSCLVTIARSLSSLENRPKFAKWRAKENSRHQVYAVSSLEFGWWPGRESIRDDRFRRRLDFVYTVHCVLLSLFSPAFASSACLRLVFGLSSACLCGPRRCLAFCSRFCSTPLAETTSKLRLDPHDRAAPRVRRAHPSRARPTVATVCSTKESCRK